MKLKNFNLKKKVFIIAEVGNNHEGNFKIAKKLVNLAAKAGADAIKFQTFKTENFIRKKDVKRFKQLKKFELSYDQFKSLKKLAHLKKLKFLSTPLDLESADFLIQGADLIKIASGDNNFFPLIDKVLMSKKSMIISTGMTNISHIKDLTKYIYKVIGKKSAENRVALLHCVTSYPVEDQFANLKSIEYLIKNSKLTIGYSDHIMGSESCLIAASLGAQIIEKHFTLDNNYSDFRDHKISLNPKDMRQMISSTRRVEDMIGKYDKKISSNEKKNYPLMRRSIYFDKRLKKGTILKRQDLKIVRPYKTLEPNDLFKVLGKKLKKDTQESELVTLKILK